MRLSTGSHQLPMLAGLWPLCGTECQRGGPFLPGDAMWTERQRGGPCLPGDAMWTESQHRGALPAQALLMC